jgi:uncharacterized protein with GYD domain
VRRSFVARYLSKVSYSVDGVRGLIAEGGTARVATVTKVIEGMGGTVHSFDFALGDDDAYLVIEMPDVVDGVAISLAVAAGGGARVSLVPLVTPAEVDAATKKLPAYRAPGS